MKTVIFHGAHLYCPTNTHDATLVREMIRIMVDLKPGEHVFNLWEDDNERDGAWFPASIGIPNKMVITIDIALPVVFNETGNVETRMSPKFKQEAAMLRLMRGVVIDDDANRVDEQFLLQKLSALQRHMKHPMQITRKTNEAT